MRAEDDDRFEKKKPSAVTTQCKRQKERPAVFADWRNKQKQDTRNENEEKQLHKNNRMRDEKVFESLHTRTG